MSPPPHWMSYIGVENVEKTLEDALQLGATLVMPITSVPGKGRFFLITDPTGAHIAFWQNISDET